MENHFEIQRLKKELVKVEKEIELINDDLNLFRVDKYFFETHHYLNKTEDFNCSKLFRSWFIKYLTLTEKKNQLETDIKQKSLFLNNNE